MLVSEYKEKFKFVIVGACAAFTYYAVYLGLKHFGLTTGISLFFSHLAGMIISYSGHALFTFEKRLDNLGQIIRYVLANLFGAIIIAGIGHVIWKFVPNDIVILAIATVVSMLLNYFLFKFYVYVER